MRRLLTRQRHWGGPLTWQNRRFCRHLLREDNGISDLLDVRDFESA